MEGDLSYYKRRLAEESVAASAAVNAKARDAHLELARRYEEQIARLLDADLPHPGLHLVSAA